MGFFKKETTSEIEYVTTVLAEQAAQVARTGPKHLEDDYHAVLNMQLDRLEASRRADKKR